MYINKQIILHSPKGPRVYATVSYLTRVSGSLPTLIHSILEI